MSDCRVLIVEDDADTREALFAALEDAGFCVEQVSDGTSGLSRLAQGGVHVVLLDMHLPDMTGEEFAEKAGDAVRIIVLTADSRMRLLDFAGNAQVLHKPVSLDDLEEAVKEACAA
ncbi:MAG TPA: response regulator [Myxococcales bacterium]|nr:response regulator [Myxococcales bacterium]